MHDAIGWRTVLTVTLSCDHRALDGADAARFLGAFMEALEQNPNPLEDA
jgi:pyruvate/2-oxoglutarate dehydrogenase complex dihydrolipoamide acyltransferase (E2) component